MLLIGCVCCIPGYRQITETAAKLSASKTILIDAGHGGMDGGAVGSDGTKEQQINLNIAKALGKEAEKYGLRVVFTRENEDGLYEEDSGKWSKVGDLKERKRIIEETNPDLVVSIHLNSFISDTNVHGAQVFFPKEGDKTLMEENKELAEAVQGALKEQIREGADRIVLSKEGMYLFRNTERHMILVECGFLSNPEDLGNLKTERYQEKIAAGIMNGIAEYYGLKMPETEKKQVIDSRTNS